ncbi:hypothetical protein L2E82_11029 [Cichorium intybus]|uniref:Uncharacterized protein n=1 Tax=Cichorium intybus TaxID=13427 RepID=A0ACB9GD60_CICIN|nr:hypothetical protein L2E82_11029 [Cichorium intybus]
MALGCVRVSESTLVSQLNQQQWYLNRHKFTFISPTGNRRPYSATGSSSSSSKLAVLASFVVDSDSLECDIS